MNLPKARTTDIIENEAGDELMIYDLSVNKAYNLNETSKNVYKGCNGQTTFEDLKHKHKFSDDLIHLALGELEKNNLLEPSYVSPFAGTSRREVIRKVGLTSMVVLPVISTLIAPVAMQAASVRGCVTLNQCQRAGTVYCPPGCTGTRTIIIYETNNGTCGGQATTYDNIDCSQLQGQPTPVDFRRTA